MSIRDTNSDTFNTDLSELQNRARKRKQQNIRSIIQGTVSDTGIPAGKLLNGLNPEWMNRFLAAAGLVEEKELQAIWSMLLQNEARESGSVSYRTLSILADWEPHDLKVFTRVAVLALESNASHFLPADLGLLSDFDVSMADLLDLEEAGVLRAERLMQPITFTSEIDGHIRNQTVVGFIGTKDRASGSVHLMECIFTSSGEQLLRAIPVESNRDFLLLYLEQIANSHPDARISAHTILQSRIDREPKETNLESMELRITFDKHDLLEERKQEKARTVASPSALGVAEKMQVVKSLQGRIACSSNATEEMPTHSSLVL